MCFSMPKRRCNTALRTAYGNSKFPREIRFTTSDFAGTRGSSRAGAGDAGRLIKPVHATEASCGTVRRNRRSPSLKKPPQDTIKRPTRYPRLPHAQKEITQQGAPSVEVPSNRWKTLPPPLRAARRMLSSLSYVVRFSAVPEARNNDTNSADQMPTDTREKNEHKISRD